MAVFYLFLFDPHQADEQTIHQSVDNNQVITDWWHGMGNTYLFTTSEPLESIRKSLVKDLPEAAYLLIQIDPNKPNASLPKAARDWAKSIQ